MDERIAPLWNGVFLLCVGFCVALWLGLAASRASASSDRRRALPVAVAVAAVLLYVGGSHALARSSLMDNWDLFPPPAMRVFLPSVALSIYLGLGPVGRFLGRRAAPALLIGAQVFRVPLELALHGFYEGGAIPVHMSFEGRNLDILSGLVAIPVALLLARGRVGRRTVLAYNAFGLLLLGNIVVVALLCMPTPLRVFDGVPNTLVVQPFYIWLPVVLVQTALVLHLASMRAALSSTSSAQPVGPVPAGAAPRPPVAPAA